MCLLNKRKLLLTHGNLSGFVNIYVSGRRVGGGGGGSRGSNEPPKIFEVGILGGGGGGGVEKIKKNYTTQSKDCDRSITRTTTLHARIIRGRRNILAL